MIGSKQKICKDSNGVLEALIFHNKQQQNLG